MKKRKLIFIMLVCIGLICAVFVFRCFKRGTLQEIYSKDLSNVTFSEVICNIYGNKSDPYIQTSPQVLLDYINSFDLKRVSLKSFYKDSKATNCIDADMELRFYKASADNAYLILEITRSDRVCVRIKNANKNVLHCYILQDNKTFDIGLIRKLFNI